MGFLSIKNIASQLREMGVKGDTDLVHVNEREKALLKAHGGSGTRNPHTGLLQYDDGGGDSGGTSSSGGSMGGYSGASRSSAGYSGGIGGNAPGGFSGYGGGGWGLNGYGIDAQGNVTGPAGFDSAGFSTSPNNPANASISGFGKMDGLTAIQKAMGYKTSLDALSAFARNPGAFANARSNVESAMDRAARDAETKAELDAQLAALKDDPRVSWNAVRAFDLGLVKDLSEMGFKSQAEALTRAYSPQYSGFADMVKGMFSGEPPEKVNTPRASLNAGLAAGHIGPNSTNDGYAITPRGYMAALAMPAKTLGGIAVGGLLGGGLAGLAASQALGAGYDAIANVSSPLAGLNKGLGSISNVAGMAGLDGLSNIAGIGGRLGAVANQGMATANIGRGLAAGGAAPSSGSPGPSGDGGASSESNESGLNEALGRQASETISGSLLDPSAWFMDRLSRRNSNYLSGK